MEVVLLVTTTSRPCLINPYSVVMARAFVLSQQKEYKCHSKYVYEYIYLFEYIIHIFKFVLFYSWDSLLFFLFFSLVVTSHTWVRPISYHYYDDIFSGLTLPRIDCCASWSGSELHCNLQAPTLKSNGHKHIETSSSAVSMCHCMTSKFCV